MNNIGFMNQLATNNTKISQALERIGIKVECQSNIHQKVTVFFVFAGRFDRVQNGAPRKFSPSFLLGFINSASARRALESE